VIEAVARATVCVLIAAGSMAGYTQSAQAATVSGTAVREATDRPWSRCDGVTANVGIAEQGVVIASVPCASATGAFSATGLTFGGANRVLTIWMRGVGNPELGGSIVTKTASAGANIVGLQLRQQWLQIRSEGGAAMTDGDLGLFDSGADASVNFDAGSWVYAPRTAVRIGSGVTFSGDLYGIDVLSVGAGASATGMSMSVQGGANDSNCTAGRFQTRPLCTEAGSTVDYFYTSFSGGADREATIEARTYKQLSIDYGRFVSGTGVGQTLTTDDLTVGAGATLDVGRNATNIVTAPFIGSGSLYVQGTLSGSAPITINLAGRIVSSGRINVPQADVTMNLSDEQLQTFGPSRYAWSVRSLTVNGNATTTAFGTGGFTGPMNSGGANVDTLSAIESTDSWCGTYAVGTLGTNGGDWFVQRIDRSTGSVVEGFGTLDTNASGSPDAWVWNSGGTNADTARAIGGSASNCNLMTVGGSIGGGGGQWAVRQIDESGVTVEPFGTTDTNANLIPDAIIENPTAGLDTVAFVKTQSDGAITVAGTIAQNANDWRVARYDSDGIFVDEMTYDSGGDDQILGGCSLRSGGDESAVVGSTQGNARVGAVDGGVLEVGQPWDSGAGTDSFTDCHAVAAYGFPDYLVAVGSSAANGTDGLAARYDRRGDTGIELDPSFGTGGFVTWGGAGAQSARSVAGETELEQQWTYDYDGGMGSIIVGTTNSGGGDVEVRRVDADGDLDLSWGTGGRYVRATAGADVGIGASATEDGIVFGMRMSSNGGDIDYGSTDYSGAMRTVSGQAPIKLVGALLGPAEGSPLLTVHDSLDIGSAASASRIDLDIDGNDLGLDVRGDLTIGPQARTRLSSARPLVVGRNLSIASTIWPGTGTVRLDDAWRTSRLTYTAATTFNNLTITGSSKEVLFDETDQTNVTGTLSIAGVGCADQARIGSTTAANQADVNVTGSSSVTGTRITDVRAVSAITATTSSDGGGNTNWTIGGCAAPSPRAPNTLHAHDTNAQLGTVNNVTIGSNTPRLSAMNRAGTPVDRQRIQVLSSNPTGVTAAWRLDGSGAARVGPDPIAVSGATIASDGIDGNGALTFDGINDSATVADSAAVDPTGDFTISFWLRQPDGGFGPSPSVLVSKGDDVACVYSWSSGAGCSFAITVDTNAITATAGSPNGLARTDVASPIDRRWHHVALVRRGSSLELSIDGRSNGLSNWTRVPGGAPYNNAEPLRIGNGSLLDKPFAGSIDELVISTRAWRADDVDGYARTRLPHESVVWDSDVSDAGVALGASCADATRCNDVVYAGAPLQRENARWWMRTKLRTAAASVPSNTWSLWSAWDWFETRSSVSISLPTGSSVDLSPSQVPAGSDATAQFDVQVTTSSRAGYAVVIAPEGSWAPYNLMRSDAGDTIPPWSGTSLGPTTWPSGTTGTGFTVLAATGGKDTARWGTGATLANMATLKFAGSDRPVTLNWDESFSAATRTATVGVRATPDPTTPQGYYTGTWTITAIPRV
jgi:hypothetical protein